MFFESKRSQFFLSSFFRFSLLFSVTRMFSTKEVLLRFQRSLNSASFDETVAASSRFSTLFAFVTRHATHPPRGISALADRAEMENSGAELDAVARQRSTLFNLRTVPLIRFYPTNNHATPTFPFVIYFCNNAATRPPPDRQHRYTRCDM